MRLLLTRGDVPHLHRPTTLFLFFPAKKTPADDHVGPRVVWVSAGIGQGFSLLLSISILGEYTHSFRAIAASYATGMLSAQSIGLVLGTFIFIVVCACSVLTSGGRPLGNQITRVAAADVPADVPSDGNARSLLRC